MRNLEAIKVGWHNINNLRYADDNVFIAENKEDLHELLNIIEEESSKKGLELNKAEVMVVRQNNECAQINIFIIGNKLMQKITHE